MKAHYMEPREEKETIDLWEVPAEAAADGQKSLCVSVSDATQKKNLKALQIFRSTCWPFI